MIGPVQLGENAACAQHCFISGQSHHYEDISKSFLRQGFRTKEVVIEHDVWIGSNSVILCGVKIGHNSVVGGGSVVTEDVRP
jgi:acetyltransferase-like isoleucine patch superfamily enzyme